MTLQETANLILKSKGIGPKGSKHLRPKQIETLDELYKSEEVALTTKSTLLCAFILLDNNELEQKWLDQARLNNKLPQQMKFLDEEEPNFEFELEKYCWLTSRKIELSEDQAYTSALLCLGKGKETQPEYLIASFLELQRVKRETFLENKNFYKAFVDTCKKIKVNTPYVLDIGEAYDGLARSPILSPFMAATLAACNIPTVLHTTQDLAPKYGLTPKDVIENAGGQASSLKQVSIDFNQENTQNAKWAVITQEEYFPEVHQLKQMRKEMVKRPFLATFERLLQPIQPIEGKLLLATGYTHTDYRPMISKLLSTITPTTIHSVIRGAEGGARPPLQRDNLFVWGPNPKSLKEILDTKENWPAKYSEENPEPLFREPVEKHIEFGLSALNGEKGLARDMIIHWGEYLAKWINENLGQNLISKGQIADVLDNGKALKQWNLVIMSSNNV
jgi:anthranilate phosphoribosyltransferase